MKRADRRARARAYREEARPMGIWRVRNRETGQWLAGASVDAPAMLNRQRAQLRFGAHPHRALQADYRRLGADAFVFEVLDTLEPPEDRPEYDPTGDLEALEALWRERLRAEGPLPYA